MAHLSAWYLQIGFRIQSNTAIRARRDRGLDAWSPTVSASLVEMTRREGVSFQSFSREPAGVS